MLMGRADQLGVHGEILLSIGHGIHSSLVYLGIMLMVRQALKRIEVIADDEDEIVEAVRRMSTNYDFVVTSGGIGPTYISLPFHTHRYSWVWLTTPQP